MARVVFLQRIWHEFGGPEILSAVLKKQGHQVDLLIGHKPRSFLDSIRDHDIAAFSVMTGEHLWALEIAGALKKKRKILTVFGGPHPTYYPEIIRHPACDAVITGEGEEALRDLADAWDRGEDGGAIPNVTVKRGGDIVRNEVRPLLTDLDALPFPDRSIYYQYPLLRNSPLKIFMSSRGCPFSCSFCFNDQLRTIYADKGRYVRFRSPEHLIQEIKEVESRYGLQSIYFVDDLFALDERWLRKFSELYQREVHKPYVCSATLHTLTEPVIQILKDSGCQAVSFGIETGNEAMRQEILHKKISNQKAEEVGRILKKYKLKSLAFNMLGLPGETVAHALETIDLNIRMGIDYPRCSILTPYPGTRIAQEASLQRLGGEVDGWSQQLRLSFKVPEPRELYNLHYFFQTAVLFPGSLGLVKRLIKLPPNPFFRIWWALVYFWIFVRSESRSPFQTLAFAFRTFVLKK